MFKKPSLLILSVCILVCLTACDFSKFINTSITPSEEMIEFDLSQYYSHGELRCGLVWVEKEISNWDTKKEYQFAYFDAEGNIKSPWFDGSNPRDFYNNYVIVVTYEEDYQCCTVYDTAFKELCRTPLVNGFFEINDFDKDGYAYIRAVNHDTYRDVYEDTFYWVDAEGLHEFEKVSQLDNLRSDELWAINSSNGYFVIINFIDDSFIDKHTSIACVFDCTGKLVLDIEKALNEQSESYLSFTVKSADVITDNCIRVLFYGADDNLYVAKMNFDGEFIEEPTIVES